MAAKNKKRGNEAEYYIRKQLQRANFSVDRGWGSDGRAMGEHEEVDLRINHSPANQKIQVKRRKQVAAYIIPSEHVDAQMLYVDRAKGVKRQVLAIVTLDRYMELLECERFYYQCRKGAREVMSMMEEKRREWYADEEEYVDERNH